jgi:hypothetical protein
MKNRNKAYTILSIFAAAAILLAVAFIFPILSEIKKNSEELVSAKNDIVVLNSQTAETENFKNKYNEYKPNLDRIDQMFVDQDNPVNFIEFLESTAADSNITSQISLPPDVGFAKVKTDFVTFQFSSKGPFLGVENFLQKIEAGPYYIEVENLTIQNSEDNTGKNLSISGNYSLRKVDAVVSIKVFTKQ